MLIDAIPLLGEETGIGTYTRNIASRIMMSNPDWSPEFYYGYVSKNLRAPAVPGSKGFLDRFRSLAGKGTLTRRLAKKTLKLANLAMRTLTRKTWDCYFEPNFILLPGFRAATRVITIHDFSCFLFPEWHPAERVAYMNKYFRQSVQNSTAIITVSQAMRKEAIELYGIAPAKLTAIPNGVDHKIYYPRSRQAVNELLKKYDLPETFILYVGAIEPRKNLAVLLRAHAALPESLRRRFPLLIIGAQGWHNSEIKDIIHRERHYVRLLGYVPNFSLPAFYSAATVFAYPSLYEGFGLPVVEAMACGCPVLVSAIPALAELCENAAVFVAPEDQEAMSRNLQTMLEDTDLRTNLGRAAVKRAAAYSWDEAAASHAALFEKLVGAC